MRNVIGPRLSARLFDHDASDLTLVGLGFTQTKLTFVAEISELPRGTPLWGQLWNDSGDVGLVIVSEQLELLFILSGTDTDREGEIQGWRFTACDSRGGPLPQHTLLIIND